MAMHKNSSVTVQNIPIDTLFLDFARSKQSTAPQDVTQQGVASSDVFRRLRADLLNCHFLPGEKLLFELLRERYGAGMGKLREALSYLAAEGLVRTETGYGFRASPVSVADMLDIAEWRVEFETKAIRNAISNGDDAWEAEIVSSYHLMAKIQPTAANADEPGWEEWIRRHQRFHDALVAACRSPWLLHFRAVLFDQAQRYRRLSFLHNPRPRMKFEEHHGIMEAVLTRDAEQACLLVEQHIRHTVDTALKNVPGLKVMQDAERMGKP